MDTQQILKKLGFSANERVVIFHADDIGMCEASVSAYADVIDFGLLSSAATMVPCAWFPATAVFCHTHPQVDMGVHLTLTSEWDNYRWSPLSTADPASGLMDGEGYFHRAAAGLLEGAKKTAVYLELKSQIKRAIAAGINITHIDTHMFTVYPAYIDIYLRLSDEFGVPAFALQPDAEQQLGRRLTEEEAEKRPLLNAWSAMSYTEHENRFAQARHYLDNFPVGISYFLVHPSKDTPELRAIAPDWRTRVADYELFTSDRFRNYIQKSGIQIIGWHHLKELL